MNKNIFIKNSIILVLTSGIINAMGFVFRIILSNKIGTLGVGLLSLVLTVYMFFATFATSGVTLAVTRLVTDNDATKHYGISKYVVKYAMIFTVFLSAVIGVFLFFASEFIANTFLGHEKAILPLKILSLSLPFMAVSACTRGYFYAKRNIFATASEQLLEQVIEMVVFFIVISFTDASNIEYGCCAVVLGTTAAEIISCFYAYILYKRDIKKVNCKLQKHRNSLIKMIKIALPVTGSACLRSGLTTLENVLIPFGLKKYGAHSSAALAQYGEIVGMVMPVLLFPNILLICFAMLIIPEMSEAKIKKREKNIEYMSRRILRFSILFAIPVCSFFCCFGKKLGVLLYGSESAGVYISILAPIVPLLYLDKIVDGMLKGLNEQTHYLIYNIIDSCLRVFLTFTLLPIIGIKGVIVVLYASAIVNSGLSIMRLVKVSQVTIDLYNWILKPIAGAVLSAISVMLFSPLLKGNLILEALLFIIIFTIFIIFSKCVSKEEVLWIKSITGDTINSVRRPKIKG